MGMTWIAVLLGLVVVLLNVLICFSSGVRHSLDLNNRLPLQIPSMEKSGTPSDSSGITITKTFLYSLLLNATA